MLVGHLLADAVFLLTLLFVSLVLRERRSPGGTWGWLLIIVLLPYLGIPAYLVIGNRKLRAKLRELSGRDARGGGKPLIYERRRFGETPRTSGDVERILLATGAHAPQDGNTVRLISGGHAGEEAYAELVSAIRGARTELSIATFVLGGSKDPVARAIVTELAARARAGVRVRLLLDRFGAVMLGPPILGRRRALAPLIAAGAEVAIFRGPVNLRNHRKLAVIDGREAIVGGMNLAQEYLGPTPLPGRWTDLAIRVEGPVVPVLQHLFESDWAYAKGRLTPPAPTQSPAGGGAVDPRGGARLQIVPSGPDLPDDSIYDAIVTAAFSARRRIWASTPYFVPDETLTRALLLACKRDIDVRIVMPTRSNHRLADFARQGYLRELHAAGGAGRLYRPGMLHAKALLVDDAFALVGSANLDMRSLLLNYELGALLLSPAEISALEGWFEALFTKTRAYEPRGGAWRETFEGLGRVVGPML